jgi:hypothetical protein
MSSPSEVGTDLAGYRTESLLGWGGTDAISREATSVFGTDEEAMAEKFDEYWDTFAKLSSR